MRVVIEDGDECSEGPERNDKTSFGYTVCRGQRGFQGLEKISSFMIPRSQSLFKGSCSKPILFGNGIGASLEFYVVTWYVTGRYLLSPVMGMV